MYPPWWFQWAMKAHSLGPLGCHHGLGARHRGNIFAVRTSLHTQSQSWDVGWPLISAKVTPQRGLSWPISLQVAPSPQVYCLPLPSPIFFFTAPITFWNYPVSLCFCSFTACLPHQDIRCCLFYSQRYFRWLSQCLVQRRCSVDIYGINEWSDVPFYVPRTVRHQ